MKRFWPYLAFAGGVLALVLLVPRFAALQPHVEITRGEARRIADAEARRLGIPVDAAWSNISWSAAPHIDRELQKDPALRERAMHDPVIGPRLGAYRVTYYRRGFEKFTPYGFVQVSGTGEVSSERLRQRPETPGANLTEEALRTRADAFVKSRALPGAPSPVFESARPTVTRSRTDWTFRYRVPSTFPTGTIVPYLWVYFSGDRFAGWELIEEKADGSAFTYPTEVAGTFLKFGSLYVVLLVLLVIFLRKYHAGEVGVGTGALVFAGVLALTIAFDVLIAPAAAENLGMGSLDAKQTAFAFTGFKLLFVDIPSAVLVFFGWAVGESFARERWGRRLASFDALLRRDPVNATVGHSLLSGVLAAPAVAAVGLLVAFIPIATGLGYVGTGDGGNVILNLSGPLAMVLSSASAAIAASVVGVLFVLAFAHRHRALPAGVVVAAVLITIGGVCAAPIEPASIRMIFGFGGGLATIAIFLVYDLLAASTALFFGCLLTTTLPLLVASGGHLARNLILALALPLTIALALAIAGIFTRREVVYEYEDLAPHVKRIIERERVKAEIDAANRIQAALLPLEAPELIGASVASHYRAATEIGGDYFDFLHLPGGGIGIAFGDVSGHGLTSGIVMAMAKSALLVQVGNDSSPRQVLDVLNDIVIRTSPRRTLMTFFFGVLDAEEQTLRFSSAGHLDPYVYRASTRKLEALSAWGFPLGVRRRDPFREYSVSFSAGDRLVLYSDGLIEAIDDDGEPFGFDRFEQTIVSNGHLGADDIKKSLLGAVRKFTRNRPPEDDQTLVVVAFEELVARRLRAVAN